MGAPKNTTSTGQPAKYSDDQATLFVGTLIAVDGTLNVTGGIKATGVLTSVGLEVNIDGAAGTNRDLEWSTTPLSDRWIARANSTAEGGANAGSDWALIAFDDTGALLGNAITVVRSTQAVTIVTGLTVTAGGLTVLAGGITITGASTITGTLGGITTLTATTLGGTLSTAAQPNVTSLGTLTSLTMGGTLTVGAFTLALAGSTVSGTPIWSSNQAITLSTAAQPNVTSLGTLTSLTISGVSGSFISNVTGAAAFNAILAGQRGGATRFYLGVDASDNFSVFNLAVNASNLTLTDAGLATFRNTVTISAGGLTVTAGTITLPLGGGTGIVTAGVADSAGAGFRLLRVPN